MLISKVTLTGIILHFHVIILLILPDGNGNVQRYWETLVDFRNLGLAAYHKETGLFLQPGRYYRSKIRLCHVTVCFHDIVSDGFWVISHPPAAGAIKTEAVDSSDDGIEVRVAFQPFLQPEIDETTGEMTLFVYEWALVERVNLETHWVTQWQRLEDTIESEEWVSNDFLFAYLYI